MPFTEYLTGLGFLAGTLLPLAAAAWMVTRRTFGYLTRVPLVSCFSVLLVTGIVGVHMIPGIFGVLSRTSVLIVSIVASALVCMSQARRAPNPLPEAGADPGEPDDDGLLGRILAAAAPLIVVVVGLRFTWLQRNSAIAFVDGVGFHLPGVARWIQSGSFWGVDSTWAPGWTFGNYPKNGNVLQLASVLPWNNDALVRFVSVSFLGLAGLGTYAIAREIRAPRSAAAVTAAMFCALPVAFRPALENGQVDTFMLATFAAGLLFLLRFSRSGRRPELVLAGLGLGLAFGTKWYSLPYVGLVLAVWAVSLLITGRPFKQIFLQVAALSGIILAAGGFWLVRNLVGSGSPLFPAKVAVGGITIFDAPPDRLRDLLGFSIADYFDRLALVRRFIVPALTSSFGLSGLILSVCLFGGLALALIARRRNRLAASGPVLISAMGALILIAYTFIPYTAFGLQGAPNHAVSATRYALPGLLIAAAVAAWAIGRLPGGWRPVVLALGLLGILDGLRRSGVGSITPQIVLYGLALTAAFAGVVALVAYIRRGVPLRSDPRGAVALLAALALASAAVAGGHVQQQAFNRTRYLHVDPVLDWVIQRTPSGHRIAIAGMFGNRTLLPLALMGPRLRNDVVFLGPTVEGFLQTYEEQAPFVAALQRGSFEMLVVGLEGTGQTSPAEELWAESAGFVEIVRSPRLVLLVSPRLRAAGSG